MSLRLFAAIATPDEISARLTPLQRGVPGASWRPRENFHITLRFFGEIDEALARDLDDELAQIETPVFEVALAGAGWFGGERPHALWVGVEENPVLRALASRCDKAARRVGLPADKRNFTPHVTLAYTNGIGHDPAARFAQRLALFKTPPFLVDRFSLYSSWTGKGPSQYVAEAEYPLLAEASS